MPTDRVRAKVWGLLRGRFREAGLVVVVAVLGLLLSVLGGEMSVRGRASGETQTVNKFMRADNLDQLAKNTSLFAIMAVVPNVSMRLMQIPVLFVKRLPMQMNELKPTPLLLFTTSLKLS